MKAVNPNQVAIKPLPLASEDGPLQKTEISQERDYKKQNVGIVVMMGRKCDGWIEVGDKVSFYRNAATPFNVEGEELLFVHQDHILAKLDL